MKLSPHQVRSVLNITEQTLRYWKQAYPELSERRGYGPCYSFGDVLMLLITKRLVERLGVEVNKLEPIAAELFKICNTPVALLRGGNKVVSIDVETMTLTLRSNGDQLGRSVSLVLSVQDLAQELQGLIVAGLGEDESEQLALALGPTAFSEKKKQAKA